MLARQRQLPRQSGPAGKASCWGCTHPRGREGTPTPAVGTSAPLSLCSRPIACLGVATHMLRLIGQSRQARPGEPAGFLYWVRPPLRQINDLVRRPKTRSAAVLRQDGAGAHSCG